MVEISGSERKALDVIAGSRDPLQLRKFTANAGLVKSAVVEREAFLRLCLVQPKADPGTVEHDVWQTIHALEKMRLIKRGRMVPLARTRQMIKRDGEAKTVSTLTLKRKPAQGFTDLIERDHPELMFEAVVLRHPETFSANVIAAARTRLVSAVRKPDAFAPFNTGA